MVRSQNNIFPAGTFSASLDGFSSGFLVSSCIKAYRLPKLRIFLPQGLLFVGACQKWTNMIYQKLMIIGSNVTAGWQLVPQGNSVCLGAFGKMSGPHCRHFGPLPHPIPLLLIVALFRSFPPVRERLEKERKRLLHRLMMMMMTVEWNLKFQRKPIFPCLTMNQMKS